MQRGDVGTRTDEKRVCSSSLLSFLVISTAIYLLPVSTMGEIGVAVGISRVIFLLGNWESIYSASNPFGVEGFSPIRSLVGTET